MERLTLAAERILMASAGLLLFLGVVIWISEAGALVGIHKLLGYALIASLWTLAGIAARVGVSTPIVVGAALWGVLVIILGLTQQALLTGSWHWVVQWLHVVISMACVPWGRWLAAQIRQRAVGAIQAAG